MGQGDFPSVCLIFITFTYVKTVISEDRRCLYSRKLLNKKGNLRFGQHNLKNSISKTEQRIPEISEEK